MYTPHTTSSRLAAAATGLLTLVQAAQLVTDHHDSYVKALLMTLVALTAGATVAMVLDHGVESRLAAGLAAVLCGGGFALTATVGLPGQPPAGLETLGALTVGLALAVVLLLAVDRSRRTDRGTDRRADVGDRESSYAS